MGMQEFIEKDFSGSFADMGRLPGLLPLLTRVNPAELLGQHYGRFALPPATRKHALHLPQSLECWCPAPRELPWLLLIVNPAEQLGGLHHGRCACDSHPEAVCTPS